MPPEGDDKLRFPPERVDDQTTEGLHVALSDVRDGALSRREVFRAAGAVTGAGLGAGVLAACGSSSYPSAAASTASRKFVQAAGASRPR